MKEKISIVGKTNGNGRNKVGNTKINRVEICFDSANLPYEEPVVVNDLIRHFNLDASFTHNVHISTSYGRISGVNEVLHTGDVSKDLMHFIIARAFIIGFNEKEVEKIEPYFFRIGDTLGVLIAGRVKEPWC